MVHSQREISPAAKLASVAIAAENVLTGENDLFVRHTNIDGEAHNAWKRH